MPPSDTYFTAGPDWGWWVVLYFFFGGLAGGSYFIASLLDLFGNAEDHRVARIGYYIAFPCVLICAPLLIIDLNRPERFWHMLIQSETFLPMFKFWSPMSVGAWALLVFGLFAFVSFVAALMEEGRLPWSPPSWCCADPVRHTFNVVGTMLGFFLASYTGVLLSVTNGPIWADTPMIGLLFGISAASTSAALMQLVVHRGSILPGTRAWLSEFGEWTKGLELVVIVAFLVSLGAVLQAWLSIWGLLLLVGVVLIGILIPLALNWRPGRFGAAAIPAAAVLVLIGGFILRAVIVFSSQSIV
jgi:protein NrfD